MNISFSCHFRSHTLLIKYTSFHLVTQDAWTNTKKKKHVQNKPFPVLRVDQRTDGHLGTQPEQTGQISRRGQVFSHAATNRCSKTCVSFSCVIENLATFVWRFRKTQPDNYGSVRQIAARCTWETGWRYSVTAACTLLTSFSRLTTFSFIIFELLKCAYTLKPIIWIDMMKIKS